MIFLFTTRNHTYTADGLRVLKSPRVPIRVKSYDWLFRQRRLTAAAAIFTDFERLNYEQHLQADRIARRLKQAGIPVLNHPARVRLRYELLRLLHDRGLNPYRVWRAEERPKIPEASFPVFLKSDGSHDLPVGEIIHDPATLAKRIAHLGDIGVPVRHILVTQFHDRPLRPGVWIRYTAYRVGPKMLTGLAAFQDHPFVKSGTFGLAVESDFKLAVDTWRDNRHADLLRPLFEIARIDYGRADYLIEDGKPVLFEINTNPFIKYRHVSRDATYLQARHDLQRQIGDAVSALDGTDHSTEIADINRLGRRLRLPFRGRSGR